MDEKQSEVQHLSRAEHIREEARRALEFGLTPRRPISLAPRFRVEGLAQTAPPRTEGPGARFHELSRVKVVASRAGNPLFQEESASLLTAQVRDELKRLDPANRTARAEKVLELLARLQIADPHGEAASALRRKALTALFGERFLKSEDTLSHDRGPHGRGGHAGDADVDRS